MQLFDTVLVIYSDQLLLLQHSTYYIVQWYKINDFVDLKCHR